VLIQAAVTGTAYSIIIPAYNEAKRIPATLEAILAHVRLHQWDAEIIVVNDGSTDDTAMVVRSFAEHEPAVRLIDNPVNRGKGSSIRDGVRRATGDVILFTDADNSTPIEDAGRLFEAIAGGAQIAVGSRWVERKLQVQPQPLHRRLNGRTYNLLLRGVLGLDLKDSQNGFKAFTRVAAQAIFEPQKIPGWGFDAESLYLAKKYGFRTAEIAVSYTYYAEGSKIRPIRDGARMFAELLKVKWFALTGAYPKSDVAWSSARQSGQTQKERLSD
jgi:glycosyltransferase involved in cell wall biosynthesis